MPKILNYGSLNIDHVYRVPHFPAPGETLASHSYSVYPGGKGLNQSVALGKAGAAVFHAGKIGQDGLFLLDVLREAGADTGYVDTSGSHTGHAVIQIDDGGQNCILLHGGANREIDLAVAERVFAAFDPGDILLLQNEVNGIDGLLALARGRGMRVAINLAPAHPLLFRCDLSGVEWFLLNEVEAEAWTGQTDPNAAADAILALHPAARVVLTLGGQGCLYADAETRLRQGIYEVPVVDTTAAGDTFTGYFLAWAAEGRPVAEALRAASMASALAVSQMGAAVSVPLRGQVLDALRERGEG